MKTAHTLLLLFLSHFGFAQTLSLSERMTRAVVVGISDYQNEDIPDLRFADKDAEAFASFLKSSAGGNLPNENIKLLLNEAATMAAVASELDWLVEESNEGDKAIIYFSGHGDVEAKTMSQPGFLLTYDSPPKIYIAGAYPLFYLQLIIQTLSTSKNVETLVITDACRAGKLAGSAIGGTQATAANLSKQYANEIKILSCQPDEFSLEGEQWGGGRGAFSYHLIEGLIGLADKNENQQVNLLELENYLETKVPEETAPQSQIPMTVGSKGTQISIVNSDILAELKSLKERQLPTLASIESKGIEQTLLAGVDSIIQQKYDAFIAALDDKNLLDAEGGGPSADELYRELIEEESLSDLHRFMTRQYATALQNDAQQVINAYLLANPNEMEKRWKGDTTYGRYPRYLGRAAELLGKEHYIYNYLIAKQLYFEGLNLRLKGDQAKRGQDFYQEALTKLQEAVKLEDRAAYFYNELGVLNTRLKQSDQAKENFEKAIELAPEWGLPYVNYCVELFYSGQYEKAIANGEKALEFLPNFPQMYNFLAWIYANDFDWLNKQTWRRKGAELSNDVKINEFNIASFSQNLQRYKRGIDLLEKAKEIDSTYYSTFRNLGAAYFQIKENKKAATALKKAIQLDSLKSLPYYYLGRVYFAQNRAEEGITALQQYIDQATDDGQRAEGYNSISWGYKLKGDIKGEIAALKKAIAFAPSNYKAPHTNLAKLYNRLGEYQKAETILLDVLKTRPGHLFTYSHLGDSYNHLNRSEDAEQIFLKGLELNPDYMAVLNKLIALYIDTEQYEKALKFQKIALEKEPQKIDHLVILEVLNFRLGNLEEAKSLSEKVNQAFPERSFAFINAGYYYLYAKYFERADYFFKKAELANPAAPVNYWNRACYFSIQEEPKKAIQSFSLALEKGYSNFQHIHTDKDAINMRAEPAFKGLMEKYFPGQVFEENAIQEESTEPIYYFENCLQLASYYEEEGETELAKALYQKAIATQPDTLTNEVALTIAEVYLKLGRINEAREICPDSISLEKPSELLEAGKLFYKLGKEEGAQILFEKYIPLSKSATPENFIGIFWKDHGEFDKAEQIFKFAEKKYPDRVYILRNRSRLYFFFDKKETGFSILGKAKSIAPDNINTLALTAILRYFDKPVTAKPYFEEAAKINPRLIDLWSCLELMRQNKFQKADEAFAILADELNAFWFEMAKYKYLQMKIRQGEKEKAIELLNEIMVKDWFVNYQLLSTDAVLDSIREMEGFVELMRGYFPEKNWE